MDAPLSNTELTGLLDIVKNLGSVGWAIVAWFAFKAKDALVTLCVAAAQYLKSIADSNQAVATLVGTMSHDIKNMRMEMVAVYDRIEEHERKHHGIGGPRLIPRSTTLRRVPEPAPEDEPPEAP